VRRVTDGSYSQKKTIGPARHASQSCARSFRDCAEDATQALRLRSSNHSLRSTRANPVFGRAACDKHLSRGQRASCLSSGSV
jgi:hypothetical protein